MNFEELGLRPSVLRAVADVGYTEPTPIQAKAIPIVLDGKDVLGIAQTGTGKTAGFTLPMIDRLAAGRARARMPRSLILEPTRELAAQVAENFELYGKYDRLEYALLIGGERFDEQVKKLDRGVDVLIATPGRMIDLFERGKVLLADTRLLVIDEADRMLDMGFIPDIERIVGLLPRKRQTLFFSATMPKEIRRLADAFLDDPVEIAVSRPSTTAANIEQVVCHVAPEDKRRALRYLLQTEPVSAALVFCNRKRDVSILYGSLKKYGFNCGQLHGDMSQPARTETLDLFRAGEIQILVCSDVAARGIDITDLSHVFNFDVPINAEDYVHRIGRTGRAGKKGKSFTLYSKADDKFLKAIRSLTKQDLPLQTLEGLEPGGGPADGVPAERSEGRRPKGTAAQKKATERREAKTEARPGRRRGSDGPPGAAEREPDSAPVVGFGDHTPAFMLQSVRRPTEAA